jgi:hypothetical protein
MEALLWPLGLNHLFRMRPLVAVSHADLRTKLPRASRTMRWQLEEKCHLLWHPM